MLNMHMTTRKIMNEPRHYFDQQSAVPFGEQLYEAMRSLPEDALCATKEKLKVLCKCLADLPSEVRNYSGRFMYNHISTLRQDDFYLLGINPGGDPEIIKEWLRDEVFNWLDWKKNQSAFDEFNSSYKRLLEELCKKLRREFHDICASNLFFVRAQREKDRKHGDKSLSKTLRDFGLKQNGDKFWPVHQAVIDIVEPKCILVIGFGAFDKIFKLMRSLNKSLVLSDEKISCGKYYRKIVTGEHETGKPFKLIGIPHTSTRGLRLEDYPLRQIADICSKRRQRSC
jgi:hypothetical protein